MSNQLHTFPIYTIHNLKIYGRTTSNNHPEYKNALVLFWTASGFSVNSTVGELWAELEGDWNSLEPWVSVWVNGAPVARFIVNKGKQWYCLFRGLPKGKVNNIMLLKETQAMSDDPNHLLAVHSLGVSRNLLDSDDDKKIFTEQETKPYKIEFIGDSITTGEGLAGCKTEMDWIPGWMSIKDNFALNTALSLNADFNFISQSGWGLTSAWDNNRNHIIPPFYSNICGLLQGERNKLLGVKNEWDFSLWQPNVVVINLGTNDYSGFNQPSFKCSDGTEWKFKLDKDNKPTSEDIQFIMDGVKKFISKVRTYNKDALILWVYGMIGCELQPFIENTIHEISEKTGDTKLDFISLDDMNKETEEEKGSRSHPGPITHKRASEKIIKRIKFFLSE